MQGEDPKDSKEYWMGKADSLEDENKRLIWMLQTTLLTRREIPSNFQGTLVEGAGVTTTTQTSPIQASIVVDRLVFPIGASILAAGIFSEFLATAYVLTIAGAVLIASYAFIRWRKKV